MGIDIRGAGGIAAGIGCRARLAAIGAAESLVGQQGAHGIAQHYDLAGEAMTLLRFQEFMVDYVSGGHRLVDRLLELWRGHRQQGYRSDGHISYIGYIRRGGRSVKGVRTQAGEDAEGVGADRGAGHHLNGHMGEQAGIVLAHHRLKGAPEGGNVRFLGCQLTGGVQHGTGMDHQDQDSGGARRGAGRARRRGVMAAIHTGRGAELALVAPLRGDAHQEVLVEDAVLLPGVATSFRGSGTGRTTMWRRAVITLAQQLQGAPLGQGVGLVGVWRGLDLRISWISLKV